MPKHRSGAKVMVADGAGGMRPVDDLRFARGPWAVGITVEARDAEAWMKHLHAELAERGWSWGGHTELDSFENSGTLQVRTSSGPLSPTIDIVWERPRGRRLRVRARGSGTPPLPDGDVRDFIEAVSARRRAGKTIRRHRRCFLNYDGLPWRGELWLDTETRIGPPSKFPEGLLGPQGLVVDIVVDGVSEPDVNAQFGRLVEELRIFLHVVLGLNIDQLRSEFAWVTELTADRRVECRLMQLGYSETSPVREMPAVLPGARQVERRAVPRPGLGPFGVWPDMHEMWVPDDIEALWKTFRGLPQPRRDQFLRAGNAHAIAGQMWPAQRTAYAAFLVVACEALKPVGRRHDPLNIYDVVASLLGASEAVTLRGLPISPQKVRSRHLHRGELVANELGPMMLTDYFADPSFDRMLMALAQVSRACGIEWLRCRGTYRVVRLPRTP